MSTQVAKAIRSAETTCEKVGVKLTVKRKNVLATLLGAGNPLSAYELVDQYRTNFGEVIPVMSVYRMLEVLMQENLVHKLATVTKYVACSHIVCDHAHELPQFLICDSCESVSELGVPKDIIDALHDSVRATGFQVASQQLELHGLCRACSI